MRQRLDRRLNAAASLQDTVKEQPTRAGQWFQRGEHIIRGIAHDLGVGGQGIKGPEAPCDAVADRDDVVGFADEMALNLPNMTLRNQSPANVVGMFLARNS